MIVVVIIGILAALGIPAFQRVRERSIASRLTNDFRQFEAGVQRYILESGQTPAAALGGVVPTGMDGYLPASYTLPSPLGGNYLRSGPSANIVLRGSSATDALMQPIDDALDDGDLTTGNYTEIIGTGYGYRVN